METRRLHRSRNNRVVAGVCGGLGEYFGINPLVFRIIFVVLLFGAGSALIPYLLLWLIMPEG